MGKISELVTVNVSVENRPFDRAGFGTPLIIGVHSRFVGRLEFYSSLEEMEDAGFLTTDEEYIAAKSIFDQDYVPEQIAVGRRDAATVAQVDTCTPIVQGEAAYQCKINSTTFTYTSDASATTAEIVAGLLALINAGTEPVTASGTATLILTADVAGTPFTTTVSANLSLVHTTANATTNIATTIQTIIDSGDTGDDWFGLILTSRTVADIAAAAAKIETLDKVFLAVAGEAAMLAGTDDANTNPAYALKAESYEKSGIVYSADTTAYLNAALLGQQFTKDPGGSNYDYKSCDGVDTDSLTTTYKNNLSADNCGWYELTAGTGIAKNVKTADGTWFDISVGKLWLKAKIEEALFEYLLENEKVIFTDAGIAGAVGKIEGVLRLGVQNKLLAKTEEYPEGYTIFAPKEADITDEDKVARELNGIECVCQLAGAVNEFAIDVKLKY